MTEMPPEKGLGEAMTIAFSARTMYEYLFSLDEDGLLTPANRLPKTAVGTFARTLEQTLEGDGDPFHRHVFVDLSRDSIEELFLVEARERFLDFGSEVVFIGSPDAETAREIEGRYDDELVTRALRRARASARNVMP